MTQLLLALRELHREKIIHRDIKPENILLDEFPKGLSKNNKHLNGRYIVLTDFGWSKRIENNKTSTQGLGTIEYSAPETMGKDGNEYGFEADFWSIGILIYELLVGERPFDELLGGETKVVKELLKKRLEEEGVFFEKGITEESKKKNKKFDNINNKAKDLIIKLVCFDPKDRLGYKGGCDEILEDPFFEKEEKDAFHKYANEG